MGRELRFERDEGSGRIRVEVRDLDGNVLRRVPPTEIFDFAEGKVTG
jgi:flagellar protein FlaG